MFINIYMHRIAQERRIKTPWLPLGLEFEGDTVFPIHRFVLFEFLLPRTGNSFSRHGF